MPPPFTPPLMRVFARLRFSFLRRCHAIERRYASPCFICSYAFQLFDFHADFQPPMLCFSPFRYAYQL